MDPKCHLFSDNCCVNVKSGISEGSERTRPGGKKIKKNKKTTAQKQSNIKNPFRHKCDSSEQEHRGPDDGPTTLWLKKTQMAVMSILCGSVGYCHVIHKSLSLADGGQAEKSGSFIPSVRHIGGTTPHTRRGQDCFAPTRLLYSFVMLLGPHTPALTHSRIWHLKWS